MGGTPDFPNGVNSETMNERNHRKPENRLSPAENLAETFGIQCGSKKKLTKRTCRDAAREISALAELLALAGQRGLPVKLPEKL